MQALSLRYDDLARMESRTVRQLQQRCVKCERSGQCALDLADEFADPGSQYWRDYCPNAATLTMLTQSKAAQFANRAIAVGLLLAVHASFADRHRTRSHESNPGGG